MTDVLRVRGRDIQAVYLRRPSIHPRPEAIMALFDGDPEGFVAFLRYQEDDEYWRICRDDPDAPLLILLERGEERLSLWVSRRSWEEVVGAVRQNRPRPSRTIPVIKDGEATPFG